ncbi:leucyl/phenylalanyl-tRNA--protein transferase [Sulfurospirillum sp. 1612]|uniref:leucyl/phenylalanyl-tRNA--protein transferase n=1 Tax=Sulfurospirillum sp. 1612 TaxID=3094835 RepID=UPI002F93BFA4
MRENSFIPKIDTFSYIFPDPHLAHKTGLLAWGGDLNKDRVLSAYTQGIFPWYNADDPILWWSPDPRLVLYPQNIKISKSLKKSMKKYEIRYDTQFDAVMNACRMTRVQSGEQSWINDALQSLFHTLHLEHFAHSVETYHDGVLVGGLYGLYLGGVFCGESMFSTKSDASKAALVGLCAKVDALGGDFIDCQIPTDHLKSMGAQEMRRAEFLELLAQSLETKSYFGSWS